jgi:hypothetical protein
LTNGDSGCIFVLEQGVLPVPTTFQNNLSNRVARLSVFYGARVKFPFRGADETNPTKSMNHDKPPDIKSLEHNAVTSIKNALSALHSLSAARTVARLSAFRLAGIARELRDLLEVLSRYGC